MSSCELADGEVVDVHETLVETIVPFDPLDRPAPQVRQPELHKSGALQVHEHRDRGQSHLRRGAAGDQLVDIFEEPGSLLQARPAVHAAPGRVDVGQGPRERKIPGRIMRVMEFVNVKTAARTREALFPDVQAVPERAQSQPRPTPLAVSAVPAWKLGTSERRRSSIMSPRRPRCTRPDLDLAMDAGARFLQRPARAVST